DDGGGDATDTTEESGGEQGASGNTINVPEDHPSIQEAVNAAEPGDLIMVAEGVYNEAVDVETDRLTIRGADRNETILDGEFKLENGIRVLSATGVAVENMTARNYTTNGFFWTGVDGYRGSYLTAYRNGDYGVYAFDSVNGLLENSYGSGSPDAGVYVGQCYPCNMVIDNFVSENNGLGYSGTNSGGNLAIINSTFRNNRAGIVPNSGSYELCYPERETDLVGNLVYSNNNGDTPAIDVALLAMGNGIVVPGGVRNTIERNRVWDHDRTGIGLVPFLEEDANDNMPEEADWDQTCEEQKAKPATDPADVENPLLWNPQQNIVRDNVVSESGLADLGIGSVETDLSELENCWADNDVTSSRPKDLQTLAPCDGDEVGEVAADGWDVDELNVVAWLAEQAEQPEPKDYKTTPEPPEQENMPDAATAPAEPATNMPPDIDLDAIEVPDKPAA
ncbi:MAG: right-handed parallel beta-helix repeat-containing protein, partial [Microthrixaceae bacterium]|nr:right-handed parallel beta-helix repeat-containing protein [Microthrixaceae bacterium]